MECGVGSVKWTRSPRTTAEGVAIFGGMRPERERRAAEGNMARDGRGMRPLGGGMKRWRRCRRRATERQSDREREWVEAGGVGASDEESPTISECGGLRFPHHHRRVPGKKVTPASGRISFKKVTRTPSISAIVSLIRRSFSSWSDCPRPLRRLLGNLTLANHPHSRQRLSPSPAATG